MPSEPQGVSCAAEAAHSFAAFVDTIAALRAPGGCPWDRAQTHESISSNMLEEAYEAVDAIEQGDAQHLREELGDVLLQVVLQSQIAADAGEFTIDDVCRDVNEKMVRRHPHVFGEASADTPDDVKVLWDKVKEKERTGGIAEAASSDEAAQDGAVASPQRPEGLLDSTPKGMPALTQAAKLSRKMVGVGFEWDTVEDVWDKVDEECRELREAAASGEKHDMELELGDILFSLVNVGRKLGVDAETSLRACCNKVRTRWTFMEDELWEQQGRSIDELTMDELQVLWEKAKEHHA